MKTPHKHAELIKAWADGAEIEYRHEYLEGWRVSQYPNWYENYQYRIKPEPKLDNVITAWVFSDGNTTVMPCNRNVRFTFDGETGKLKAAEVL